LKTKHFQGELPSIFPPPRQPTSGPDLLKNELFLAQIGTRLVLYSPLPALKGAWNMRSKLALFLRITGLLGHWLRIFLNSAYEQKM